MDTVKDEQKKYGYSCDEVILGRLVLQTLNRDGFRAEKIYIFTTVQYKSAEEILSVYKLRWNVETDLKNIKMTLKVDLLW